MSRAPVEHESRRRPATAGPASTISGPGAIARRIGRQQHLEAQHGVERDIEQQAGQHRRDRRRAFGMGVGQPGVQRRQADLGAIAQQQEDEGEIEQRRVELRRHASISTVQTMPCMPSPITGRAAMIDQDGAEQRQRDADAAEDEIFPRRLERLVGAVDADHQHGGQRRDLDRHPHQADIVGDQRQVHGEEQHLIHGVIEAQMRRRQPAGLELVARCSWR